MNHYKLRVTLSSVDEKTVRSVVEKYAVGYALCREVGSETTKAHVHLYVLVPSVMRDATIRSRHRKAFGKGNEVWSMGKLKYDGKCAFEYLAYMCKDGDVSLFGTFSPDWLDVARQKQKDFLEARKKSKKSNLSQYAALCALCEEWIGKNGGQYIDPNVVPDIVLEYYLGKGSVLRKNYMQQLVQSLLVKYSLPEFKHALRSDLIRGLGGVMMETDIVSWDSLCYRYTRSL